MQKSHEKSWEMAQTCFKSDLVLEKWLEKVPLPKWPFQNYMSEDVGAEDSLLIYFALTRAIVSQQLSTASARSILKKVQKIGGNQFPLPEQILKIEEESLRECGLSRQKITYLKAVAHRAEQKILPPPKEALAMDSKKLREILIEIPGVGDWSADMVMIFALHHPDIFAAGDFGVREGYRLIYGLEKQPTPKALAKQVKKFSPFRSLLTGYCWAVKEFMKNSSI